MIKTILTICAVAASAMVMSSCGGDTTNESSSSNKPTSNESSASNEPSSNEVNISNEVTIGTQVWMTKNLDVATFRNGDPIPEAKTHEEWQAAGYNKQPAWCYYDNTPVNGAKYGKLYNWYAVADPRKLCPEGWHVPNDSDWSTLIMYLGGDAVAGGKMKSTMYWTDNYSASNESGFNGLPGGDRFYNGSFYNVGDYGYWWSSSEYNTTYAWNLSLFYLDGGVLRNFGGKEIGLSVRCLRD